jgi:hypothetical protein
MLFLPAGSRALATLCSTFYQQGIRVQKTSHSTPAWGLHPTGSLSLPSASLFQNYLPGPQELSVTQGRRARSHPVWNWVS